MGSIKSGTFRSLAHRNYRIWAGGAIVSNVGTWMQRTAQDWLVLTALTNHNATAVGIVMALQFGPQVLFLPVTGLAADYLDRRKLLIATQTAMGLLALGLGLLTITGLVQLWQVYLFAFMLGCVTAFDAPARQTFVAELVPDTDLSNAVALNSASFNAARMIGPAVAGLLIAGVGTGWVFLINAVTYLAVIGSLLRLRLGKSKATRKAQRVSGGLADGFRYVRARSDLKALFVMLFLVATFGLNFPIYISTMSVSVFHAGSYEYGILSSTMAIGSVCGALLAARRARPRIAYVLAGAGIFGIGCTLAAISPNYWLFGIVLVVLGIAAQTFNTTVNSSVQMSTDITMRGRVMAIYMAISMGGTLIGAPVVGWVADAFGARWALGVGAASGVLAVLAGVRYLIKHRQFTVRRAHRQWRFTLDGHQVRLLPRRPRHRVHPR